MDTRNFFICLFTSVLEWYDFVVYSSLAPIISLIFFPSNLEKSSLLLTFAIFATSFVVRPLGGLFFGHIADRYGRRRSFISTSILITFSSLGVALLPAFTAIGWLSPILLLVFRAVQGFCVGGEYPIYVAYLIESSNPKRVGFVTSFVNVSTTAGAVLGMVVVAGVTHILTKDDLMSWGWRIPFLISSLALIINIYLRKWLNESPIFQKMQYQGALEAKPLLSIFKKYKLRMLRLFIVVAGAAVGFYSYNVFSVTYLTNSLHYSYQAALKISLQGSLLLIFLIPLFGILSDKIARKNFLMVAATGLAVFSIPIFILLNSTELFQVVLAQIIFAVILAIYLSALPAFIGESFNIEVRCSGMAFAYNCSLAIFGGTLPVINMLIMNKFHNTIYPAFYLMLVALISLVAILSTKKPSFTKAILVN